jgi:hypothetical protein
MKRARFVGKWVLMATLTCVVAVCSQPLTVEQQVITAIREMESSIEIGERGDFMAHVAENFIGQDAAMTRDQLNALVFYQLNQHEQIQVQFMPIYITPTEPGKAEGRFDVLLTGGQGWLPHSGQVFSFVTGWRLEGDEWLLRRASWEPVTIDPVPE